MMVTHMDWTPEQQTLLDEQEVIIEHGRAAFDKVTSALIVIKTEKLYLKTHPNFGDYCSERWGFTKQWAYKLLKTVDVDKVLDGVNHGLLEGAEKLKKASAKAKLEMVDLHPDQVEEVAKEIQETKTEPTQGAVRKIVAKVTGVPEDDEEEIGETNAEPPPPNDARCPKCGKLKGGKTDAWKQGLVCLCPKNSQDIAPDDDEEQPAEMLPLKVPEARPPKIHTELDNNPVLLAMDNEWAKILQALAYSGEVKPLAVYQRLRVAVERVLATR